VRLDAKELRVAGHIDLAGPPTDFDLTRDGRSAAVSHGAAGTLEILSVENKARRVVRAGSELGPVRFRSDDRCVLAGNFGRQALSIYDVGSGGVVAHLPLAVKPENFCFRFDGGQMFITGEGSSAVVIVYPHNTPQVAETVLAGQDPGAMGASLAEPDVLFIANPPSGDVTILNIPSRRVIARVSVGADPGFVTVTPDNQYALVLNRRSGDMAVIWISAIVARRTKSAPLFTMVPVGSRPVAAAVREL
jgi:YVTN family beta-propeller protein